MAGKLNDQKLFGEYINIQLNLISVTTIVAEFSYTHIINIRRHYALRYSRQR